MPPEAPSERGLIEDAKYLNLDEIEAFCRRHELPRHIVVQRPDDTLRRTRDRDRKDVVLRRILDFALRGERTGPTVYPRGVVAVDPLPEQPTARTRLRYGHYDKKDPALMAVMGELTDGAFRSGMIARLVLRDFWTRGEAPTLRRFANAWLAAGEEHTRPRPEAAYLTDGWSGDAGPDWKRVRHRRAARALARLEELVAMRST